MSKRQNAKKNSQEKVLFGKIFRIFFQNFPKQKTRTICAKKEKHIHSCFLSVLKKKRIESEEKSRSKSKPIPLSLAPKRGIQKEKNPKTKSRKSSESKIVISKNNPPYFYEQIVERRMHISSNYLPKFCPITSNQYSRKSLVIPKFSFPKTWKTDCQNYTEENRRIYPKRINFSQKKQGRSKIWEKYITIFRNFALCFLRLLSNPSIFLLGDFFRNFLRFFSENWHVFGVHQG